MRGLEKNCMKKGTNTHANRHRDSMKESAKGRFFENPKVVSSWPDPGKKNHKIVTDIWIV